MSLSKVYQATETFQPEDIVQRKEKSEPVWKSILRPLTDSAPPPKEPKDGLQTELPTSAVSPSAPPNTNETASREGAVTLPDIESQDAPDEMIPETEPPITAEQVMKPEQPAGLSPEVVEQMVAEAFEKGVRVGEQQAEDDFGSAAKSLLIICQQLDHLRETIIQNSIGEMQDLVLTIAEKIIRHSVLEQHSTIIDTIDEAIHKAVKSDEFYVYINPDDYEIVAEKSVELVAGLSGLNNLVIKKDGTIERGGCRVESDNCIVDATIVSQLEIIRDQIKNQR